MTDKERLIIILDNSIYDHNFEEFTVPLKDMDWLVNQAERVEELEEKIKLERRMNKDLHKLVKFLQENPKLAQDRWGDPVSLVAISAMELLQKENKHIKQAWEIAKTKALEWGAEKNMPDDDEDVIYQAGLQDMFEDFVNYYEKSLKASQDE